MTFSTPTCACLHRLVAVLASALVLALTILAVCPATHACLHGAEKDAHCTDGTVHDPAPHHDGGDPDDDCVVVKFAHGEGGLAAAPQSLAAPVLAPLEALTVASDSVAAASAYFLPPGCGPPAV